MPGISKVRGVGGVSELLVVTASPDCLSCTCAGCCWETLRSSIP